MLAGATDVLKDVLHSIAVKGPLGNVEEGRDIVAAVMKGLREEEFLIDRMIRLQARDDYTVAHSLNVCVMVVAQAARLDLSEASIREIGLAALLHDIGKELVPAEILNKPGKLDTGEFAKISLHPVLGATHLRKMSLGSDLPVIVCYEHHIRHDRSGYPTPRFPGRSSSRVPDDPDRRRVRRPADVPAVSHESRPGDGARDSPRGTGDGVRARAPRPLSPDDLLIPALDDGAEEGADARCRTLAPIRFSR